MKPPLTAKAPGIGLGPDVPGDRYVDAASAGDRAPLDLDAVRWVLVATILFWLIVFCIGCYFFSGAGAP